MKKGSHNNIEEKMSGGGSNSPSLDMEQFIKMADKEKIEFSVENDLFETLEKQWLEEREPGEPFDSWLNRTPVEALRRIELKGGGKVINFAEYAKMKDADVKEINLAAAFENGRTVSSLSEKDKEMVSKLLQMSGIGRKE